MYKMEDAYIITDLPLQTRQDSAEQTKETKLYREDQQKCLFSDKSLLTFFEGSLTKETLQIVMEHLLY